MGVGRAASVSVDGVLLVYNRALAPWIAEASTVTEHVRAFARHSRHRIWAVNTDVAFPPGLDRLRFRAVILHYSLFGIGEYALPAEWLHYLDAADAYKIAFFQDECTRCRQRFAFLDEHEIDCVYTCLEPSEFDKVYGRYTCVPSVVSNVPGYVSDELSGLGARLSAPEGDRGVDVGYRGRPLPASLGRGAAEKHEIGVRFAELARDRGLTLDVETAEAARLYGKDWYRFLANCRCVLGVESGVSCFDLEDEVLREHERRAAAGLPVGLEDLETLPRWEDVVYYRTISPRHFEAAALRVCQVLYEGRYSGALEPMVHYIPLAKDFSNLDAVLELIRDPDVRRELTENAHRDLIASGDWSYAKLIDRVDETLTGAGATTLPDPAGEAAVRKLLLAGRRRRHARRMGEWVKRAALLRAHRMIVPVSVRVRRALGVPRPGPLA
jgi:hypothetical protein